MLVGYRRSGKFSTRPLLVVVINQDLCLVSLNSISGAKLHSEMTDVKKWVNDARSLSNLPADASRKLRGCLYH